MTNYTLPTLCIATLLVSVFACAPAPDDEPPAERTDDRESAISAEEEQAAADPCAGKPDISDAGCGQGYDADGNVVPASRICIGGKTKTLVPCRFDEMCVEQDGLSSCKKAACAPGTPGRCYDGNYHYCDNGTWKQKLCTVFDQVCNPHPAAPETACADTRTCDGSNTPRCAGPFNVEVCGVNGNVDLVQCPGMSQCFGPPSGCYGIAAAGGECGFGWFPSPPQCDGHALLVCNMNFETGTWTKVQCPAGTACDYDSNRQAVCRDMSVPDASGGGISEE